MTREKRFEAFDHSRVMSLGNFFKGVIAFVVFAAPLLFALYDTSALGQHFISGWLGVESGKLHLFVWVAFYFCLYFVHRVGYLSDFFAKSNREPVRTIYDSQILRLTYTLLSIEDQELIMEAVYADWLEERSPALEENKKFELLRIDAYYYAWFCWRIWRETRFREIHRKKEIRFGADYLKPPSILPK